MEKYYAAADELQATADAIRLKRGVSGDIIWQDRTGFAEEIASLPGELGSVTPEMFGAKGDGEQDDTAAWKAAIATGMVIRTSKDYLISEPLSLTNSVYCDGTIYYGGANTDTALTVSGQSNKSYRLRVARKTQDSGQCTGILVENSNACTFELYSTNFYYGAVFRGKGAGCSYNTVLRAVIANSKYHLLCEALQDSDGVSGWCNENYFYNGRCIGYTGSLYQGNDYGITIRVNDSTHAPNALVFINWSLEYKLASLYGAGFLNCVFENIRTENSTKAVDWGTGAVYNTVVISYGTTEATMTNPNNSVRSLRAVLSDELDHRAAGTGPLYKRTASNASYATGKGLYRVNDTGTVIEMLSHFTANEKGLKSDGSGCMGFLVNVHECKRLKVICHATGTYRPYLVPFDRNGAFLDGATIYAGTATMSQTTRSGIGKLYVTGDDYAATKTECVIGLPAAVESVFVGVWAKGVDTIIRDLEIFGKASVFEEISQPAAMLDAVPTEDGFYPEQTVYKSTGGKKWVWDGSEWDEVSL